MIRVGERVFVDTGAWIALALTRDSFHERAVATWEQIESRAKLCTSVPVVIETFTFLERNTTREVALRWKDALGEVTRLELLECTSSDLERSWKYFETRQFHKLSAVDATSFVLMEKSKTRVVFGFDTHFALAGFRFAG